MEKLEFFKILPLSAEKDEYTIVCGTMQATPKTFKTIKEAQSYIKQKPYDLITRTQAARLARRVTMRTLQ